MADETTINTQPETNDHEVLLLKKIAACLQRAAGNVPTRTCADGSPLSGVKCFGMEAGANGAVISSITAPNHTGSLANFQLAGGQTLDVYFTDLTLASGSGPVVCFDSQIDG